MNLDSKAKRMAGMNHGCPWRGILPDSDGSVSQADRQHLTFMYIILAGAITSAVFLTPGHYWGPL